MKNFIKNYLHDIIWVISWSFGVILMFIGKVKLSYIPFGIMGFCIVIFRDKFIKDNNAWYERMSKRFPVLYPSYTPNIKFQKILYTIVGLGFILISIQALLS